MSGRDLPAPSAFSQDDGAADPELSRALESRSLEAVVAALGAARVLVPILTVRAEAEPAGGAHTTGRQTHANLVSVATADGRAALPVFTDLAAVAAWQPQARPLPVWGNAAALSAHTEADGLLVINPATQAFLIPRPATAALAQGQPWQAPAADPLVVAAMNHAAPAGVRLDLEDDARGGIVVNLTLPAGLTRAEVEQVIQSLTGAVAQSQVVAERVDSVRMKVIAASSGED